MAALRSIRDASFIALTKLFGEQKPTKSYQLKPDTGDVDGAKSHYTETGEEDGFTIISGKHIASGATLEGDGDIKVPGGWEIALRITKAWILFVSPYFINIILSLLALWTFYVLTKFATPQLAQIWPLKYIDLGVLETSLFVIMFVIGACICCFAVGWQRIPKTWALLLAAMTVTAVVLAILAVTYLGFMLGHQAHVAGSRVRYHSPTIPSATVSQMYRCLSERY